MGGYDDLKTAIAALIHTNDNQEITGATLQSALLSIINTIGQGSVFKGVATTSTNPGSPDANVFYIAGRPGYYPNFNLELTAGLHVIENKSGTWVNTEIALDVVDAINIGGAKHVKPSQAMIIALQSVEQIPDSEGRNNAMWWSTDGNLKYKQNDTVYNLGAPAYVLYYCGDKIYKWTGSGFREIGGGGTFASGEAVSNMSIFDDGSDTDGKSSAQLAAMIPSGEVIKSLLQLISSIDTSGGSYDGVDLITTFSYDAPTRVITVKQSGRQAKTILLPLANSTNPGLMSSEDKTALANMQNLIGKTVNSFSKSTGETGITITLVTSNGTPYAVLIPIDSVLSSQSTSNLVTGAAIYNFLMSGFVYLDQDSRAYAPYTRILPLVSMGSALDNGNTPAQINTNEFRYDPTTKRIYRHNNNQQPYFTPSRSQLYLNICTGKMYKWAGSDMEEISGGVDPATLAGKADKHTAADILTPSQWPHVMIYNIESMRGAGGTPPDYASIPVGSIYLDDSDGIDDPPYRRLFYKKTLEGTSQRIDLGAPQENTIYCHIATGKLYRWVPTQNGNDGAFQQIGGGAGSTISPATIVPSMDGNTAAVGVSDKYAREDHVHPKDTSKQDKLTSSTTLMTINGNAVHYGESVTVQGEKGEQGETGHVQVDGNGNVLIYNGRDMTITGAALDASQGQYLGKMLNAKDNKFYNVWVGTQAELDALDEDYDADTIYIVGTVPVVAQRYNIVFNGTHTTIPSNTPTSVKGGSAFSVVVSAVSGYAISSATGTMVGGTLNKTENQDGTVTFSTSSVTGDISITASASVDSNAPIVWEDANMEAFMLGKVTHANPNYITYAEAAAYTNNTFSYDESGANYPLGSIKSVVTKFNEWQYFTGLTGVNLKDFTALTEVTMPSTVVIGTNSGSAIVNTAITHLVIPEGVTTISQRNNLSPISGDALIEIDYPSTLTSFYKTSTPNLKVLDLSKTKITTIGGLKGMSGVEIIKLPKTLTTIGTSASQTQLLRECTAGSKHYVEFGDSINGSDVTGVYINPYNGPSDINLIFHTSTPPEFSWGTTGSAPAAIYVPDDAVATYQAATGFSSHSSKIKGLSELPSGWDSTTSN